MPVHDWSRVDPAIFHDFHHSWVAEIQRALNAGLLPEDHYALVERHLPAAGPDVAASLRPIADAGAAGGVLSAPKARLTAETALEFYRRKQNTVTVRHVSGDRVVAMVEVVSPGNKNTRNGLRSFVEKAAELLDKRVHLLLLDLHPPGRRDPSGIHGVLWEEIAGEEYEAPPGKPLTVAAYESGLTVRAYVELVAVGDPLPEMPVFLEPGEHVPLPLEATYQAAWNAFPRRWQRVVQPPAP